MTGTSTSKRRQKWCVKTTWCSMKAHLIDMCHKTNRLRRSNRTLVCCSTLLKPNPSFKTIPCRLQTYWALCIGYRRPSGFSRLVNTFELKVSVPDFDTQLMTAVTMTAAFQEFYERRRRSVCLTSLPGNILQLSQTGNQMETTGTIRLWRLGNGACNAPDVQKRRVRVGDVFVRHGTLPAERLFCTGNILLGF